MIKKIEIYLCAVFVYSIGMAATFLLPDYSLFTWQYWVLLIPAMLIISPAITFWYNLFEKHLK